MATMGFYNAFFADAMNKVHNLGSDTLKIALTNTTPVATHTTLSQITEIASGNGYTSGGQALDNVTSAQVSGVLSLDADDEIFTASGGAIAQFQHAVLYNSTASNKLIGYWSNGTAVDLADSETCTITFAGGTVFTFQIDS
jgi:hypothetical protein